MFLLGLLPLVWLVINALMDRLGANPVEVIIQDTGQWTLRFLILTLCVTPLRLLSGWHDLNKRFNLRRLWGMYAFFYGCLHFLSYLWFDQFFEWPTIFNDLITRPSMSIGFLAFALMIPLAVTSNSRLIKRLGKQRWKRLHQLIYPISIAGVIHFWWLAQTKADVQGPLIYAAILAGLLLIRFPPLMNRLAKKK